ncbi:MAG: TonB family protein [Undibacterium sp.]|uniref:energy transducer TonB n=1 Tax=Undibacterium sp. TaxID=1914977 RepID=UPI00271DB322|nr:energy transducer TonB [Undibacterium sp.]MDO8651379.1 TonB family protein [Undibacterium sp.]
MKSIFENLILTAAIFISVVVHGMLLLMHFVAPQPAETQATDPGLEVILVNAKHDKKPLKAEALAQANLDGGGAHDTGRSKSPLPDMRKTENGESVMMAKRRIEELEENQKKLMDQVRTKTPFTSQQPKDDLKPEDNKIYNAGRDKVDSNQALARMAAEISQTIEDQNKRPRKTFITPSTQAVGYAMYYKALQKRVEDMGTMNFPQKDGKKLYGELIIYIPIFQDGSIYEKGGGPKVEKSSGNAALDAAALRIVRRAAPFGKFPPNMRSKDKDDLWVVITRFKFTRDQMLETELRGGGK